MEIKRSGLTLVLVPVLLFMLSSEADADSPPWNGPGADADQRQINSGAKGKPAAGKRGSGKDTATKRKSQSAGTAKLIASGKKLFSAYQCSACHLIGASGNKEGIPLDGIGSRRKADFLTGMLRDPEAHVEKHAKDFNFQPNLMPNMQLTESEIKALVAYLQTLK